MAEYGGAGAGITCARPICDIGNLPDARSGTIVAEYSPGLYNLLRRKTGPPGSNAERHPGFRVAGRPRRLEAPRVGTNRLNR